MKMHSNTIHIWVINPVTDRDLHARSLLRAVLSNYVNIEAPLIDFEVGEFGKPKVCSIQNPGNITFNISHTNDYAMIAVARDVEIGIDIEMMRPIKNIHKLAQRFFHHSEHSELKEMDDILRHDAFFQLWTCKEAAIKSVGKKISGNLRSILFDKTITCVPICAPAGHKAALALYQPSNVEHFAIEFFYPKNPYRDY